MSIKMSYGRWMLFLASVFILAACGAKPEKPDQSEKKDAAKGPERLPSVRVIQVLPMDFDKKIEVIGACRALKTVNVSSEEPGIVREIHFDKGDKVKKGTLLVRLDDELLRASLKELEAAYEMESLNHEKLEALKKGRGAVSDFDLRNALLKKEMAAARVENLRVQLRKKGIESPINGTVEKKGVEKGEFINPGMVIATVMDLSSVKVEAAIAEKDLSYFRKGAAAEIAFNAWPGETFAGRVDYVSPEVDRTSGTFYVEIDLPNVSKRFRPGMMAMVRLVKSRCKGCLVVPKDAVIDTEEGPALFVVDAGNAAEKRRIELSETDGDQVVVSKGIVADDRVVVAGHRDIVHGEKVKVVE